MRAQDIDFLAGESAAESMVMPPSYEEQLEEVVQAVMRKKRWDRRRATRYVKRHAAKGQARGARD